MKRYKNIFNDIISIQNLLDAFHQTSKGKSRSHDYLEFEQYAYFSLTKLHHELDSGLYSVGDYINFTVFDPKPRNITALQFRDRIVQRAIYNVIQPIFDKTFLPNSFACRAGKGTHRCAITTQSYMRKSGSNFYLKTDFSKYFLSIDRRILWDRLERKIGCAPTLNLIEKFVPKIGVGINIGELLSQLLANVYGNILDYYLKHDLRIKYFTRYMDDIVIFGESVDDLKCIKNKIDNFAHRELKLKFSKWYIKPCSSGINFVGYRIFNDFKLLRRDSIKRAKRKIKKYTSRKDFGNLKKFLGSWLGHIAHANSFNLKRRMGIDEILLQLNN